MIRDHAHWCSLANAFHHAAITADGWYPALEALAEATGSWCAELIGGGANAAMSFHIITKMDVDSFNDEFMAVGGPDPRFNPRFRAGFSSPVLEVLAESDFITEDEHKRHPHYEFSRRWDVPYSCLATLERRNGMLIGLAVLRSERQGHIEGEERAAFAALAPLVQSAVRTQIALARQGVVLFGGVMETLSATAFVCDGRGVVEPVTSAAERLVAGEASLQLKGGRFRAAAEADTKALNEAIQRVAADGRPDRPLIQTLLVRGSDTLHPLVLDVIALPTRRDDVALAPRALILARGRDDDEGRKAGILQNLYSLTSAETDVALELSAGRTPDVIARRRGVKVGTVRAQTKSLLAKVGVRRQVELVAQVGRLRF